MARNLKNLVEDYDEDEDEIGGIQRINRRPKLGHDNRYTSDNREIQKKRRERDKMRKAATRRQELEEE